MKDISCIVLAAGEGTRMKSSLPKVMHPVLGTPMIFHLLRSITESGEFPIILVVGRAGNLIKEEVQKKFPSQNVRFAWQRKRLGTADAVKAGLPFVPQGCKNVVVLMGDMPLVSSETISRLVTQHRHQRCDATIGTALLENPTGYCRVIRSFSGKIIGIKEERECNPDEKKIKEINTGIYCFSLPFLKSYIKVIGRNNAAGEYYLTDIAQIAASLPATHITTMNIPLLEARGINDRMEIAAAENALLDKIRGKLMRSGVSMLLPHTIYVEPSVKISPDTVIEPSTVIRGNTVIGCKCTIAAGCNIIDSTIEDGAIIHPHCVIVKSVIRRNTQVEPFTAIIEGILKSSLPQSEVERKKHRHPHPLREIVTHPSRTR